MKMRKLGAGGPMVSAIGLGCMGMAGWYGVRNDEEAAATIHHALDCGVTLLDTADVYGQGENEQFVGATIKGRRDEVFLATKCGNSWAREGWQAGLNASPDYVRAACEQSLKRLGTDVIDLYQLHRVDPKTAIEDTMGAMAQLVEAGKIRFVGLSEAGPATIRRAPPGPPARGLAIRAFVVDPRPRDGLAADVPGTRHRLRRLQPARARHADGPAQEREQPSG